MEVDLTPTPTSTQSPNDTEIDTPPFTIKPLSYSYANSKHPHPPPPPIAAAYKECMKNHAAAIGGHAVDGCGEFMPSPSSAAASLTCAACGCHRNFHRRDPESPTSAAITPPFLDFRHPPLPKRFSLSPSPPPAPARLFYGVSAEDQHPAPVTPTVENSTGRKRFRTKFSNDQKEKMLSFSRKLGWKMQKSDEAAVKEFCHEVGVPKGVLKVWMHNNKNTFTKKDSGGGGGGGITNDSVISYDNSSGADERRSRNNNNNGNTNIFENENSNANANANGNANGAHFHTHGCSSSSPP